MILIDSRTIIIAGVGPLAGLSLSRRAPLDVAADGTLARRRSRGTVCDHCGGRRVVQVNASEEVGAQEYVPCPQCRPARGS